MDETVFHTDTHFSGRVQGVGFRYHVRQIANEFDVAGYVQNLSDGRVRMEAEGIESDVCAFQSEIEDQMASFIRHVEANTKRRSPQFSGFTIR